MPDDPSDDGHETGPSPDDGGELTASLGDERDRTNPIDGAADEAGAVDEAEAVNGADAVDDDVQRRLREAYLNDEESVLVVTGVRSTERHVVVEFRPPHGGSTHVERFPAPRDGSLAESEAFLAFLDAAGVSPLDVDELAGTRVPATYDPDEGWRLDEAYVGEREADGGEGDAARPGLSARWNRTAEWLWTYRYWLVAVLLVGGELLFVAVIILLFA
jgi:hypothetical protein